MEAAAEAAALAAGAWIGIGLDAAGLTADEEFVPDCLDVAFGNHIPPGPNASPANLGCLSSMCFFMAEMRTNFLRQTGQLKVVVDALVEDVEEVDVVGAEAALDLAADAESPF